MKKALFKRILSLALIAACLLSMAGCAGSAANQQKKFQEFTDEMFRNELRENIINLHCSVAHPENYGIDEYEISLGDFSAETDEKIYEAVDYYKNELSGFKYEKLTAEQQLTYDIISTYLSDISKMEGFRLYNDCMSPLNGMQSYLPTILAEYAFYDEQDVEDYLETLRIIPSFFESMIDFAKEQSEAGFFMQDFETDRVIDQCAEFTADPDNHYLIERFNARVDAAEFLQDSRRDELKKEDAEIIKNTVIPAYEYLSNELKKLKGTCKNDGGLANFENGKEYYELLIRNYTGSDKSVEELKEIISDKMDDDIVELMSIAMLDAGVLDKMTGFKIKTDDYEGILNDLKSQSENDFPAMPDREFDVNFVPESMEKYASPAYYILPPIDDMSDNSIYINSSMATGDIEMFGTLAHEGFPGHMYQTNCFYETNPLNVRKILGFTGYSEGWGTYAEIYSYRYAGLEENVRKACEINKTYSFAIYCLSDIGINYEGWTRDEAMDYLLGLGLYEEDAREIYETLVMEPGLYLAYYVGYLELMELREEAENALGDKFNIKNFHEFILKTGPAQFEVIEKYMQDWINTQK